MMHDHTFKAIIIGVALAALNATPVSAGPAAFTWNPGAATPAINGGPFTADQISTTDFLFNRSDSTGLAFDDFILRIDSVSRNGTQVSASGLGSAYGLYLLGHVTLHAGPGGVSIYDSGTVSLIADPTNNNGTVAATWNVAAQSGGVSFSNPGGTADDIVLAMGGLLSGSFGLQSNGQLGVRFVNDFRPVLTEAGFFVSPTDGILALSQELFNTATSRVAGSTLDGGGFITVNNGFGVVDFQIPEPATLGILGFGLTGLLIGRRRRIRS